MLWWTTVPFCPFSFYYDRTLARSGALSPSWASVAPIQDLFLLLLGWSWLVSLNGRKVPWTVTFPCLFFLFYQRPVVKHVFFQGSEAFNEVTNSQYRCTTTSQRLNYAHYCMDRHLVQMAASGEWLRHCLWARRLMRITCMVDGDDKEGIIWTSMCHCSCVNL